MLKISKWEIKERRKGQMNHCTVCGGGMQYINDHIGQCEYCGRLYSLKGNELLDASIVEIYGEAIGLSCKSGEKDVLMAVQLFEALGNYKDSAQKALDCKAKMEQERIKVEDRRLEEERRAELERIERQKQEFREKRKKEILIKAGIGTVAVCLIVVVTVFGVIHKRKSNYSKALALYEQEQYEEALEVFEKLKEYSDSEAYVSNIRTFIQERDAAYARGVNYYNNGQYLNAVKEFENCLRYLDAQEYLDKATEEIYREAKAIYESKNYKDAQELLNGIPKSADIYNDALVLLSEVNEIVTEQENAENYERAVSFYEDGDYEAAQKLFINLNSYEDTANYLAQIGETFYNQAADLYNQKEYVLCGEQIARIDSEEKWSRYAEALDLKQQAADAYKEIIMEQAKSICRKEGDSAMKSFLDDSVCTILSANEANSLKEVCFVDVVALNTLEPYIVGEYSQLYFRTEEKYRKDSLGNIYLFALSTTLDASHGECSNTYFIDKKYSFLAATVAVDTTGPLKDSFSGVIRIYGDGKLLWSDERLKRDTKPYDIEVDISGISDLKIEMYGQGYFGGDRIWVLLGNPTLSE